MTVIVEAQNTSKKTLEELKSFANNLLDKGCKSHDLAEHIANRYGCSVSCVYSGDNMILNVRPLK